MPTNLVFYRMKGEMPQRKKHLAILSKKDVKLTGEFTECRTIKDWQKKGWNDCLSEIQQKLEMVEVSETEIQKIVKKSEDCSRENCPDCARIIAAILDYLGEK